MTDTLKDLLNIGTKEEEKYNFWKSLSKGTVAKQLTVGAVTGWCSGVTFAKVGKVAAASIGASLLLFQLAHHQGYIKVNWSLLNKDIENAKRILQRRKKRGFNRIYAEVEEFLEENIFLATGFTGGFLFGIATS
ncbi:FUN14 domain-containing protein 1-like [Centruroides vittatus]|uniref:FUN14 domain-containing protein 1-like n=1 Tax=Centruroides vittatus TaxID=120091 RepID=UPI0035106864